MMDKKETAQEREQFKSKVTNCIIDRKNEDDILFYINNNKEVLCSLDGYAIIPVEKYNELIQK